MKERQRWQPEEDATLRSYVKRYGPNEWNLISQRMGEPFNRDPKSCLERWKNYPKPGIKKGSLTPEEQALVVSRQSKYGNKWKKIAGHIPGRTAKKLGKWWEVFKEKQARLNDKEKHNCSGSLNFNQRRNIDIASDKEERGIHKYDHILETFAEKYVQPKINNITHFRQPVTLSTKTSSSMHDMLPRPEPDPVLSFRSVWMINAATPSSSSSSISSSLSSSKNSGTPSPVSLSLTLSPIQDPDPDNLTQIMPGSQQKYMNVSANLLQYCKEVDESRQDWLQHKKEAAWRLCRLEQQLEAEKARKKKEKMEDIEAKIRALREEEMGFLSKTERDCREQLLALCRDAESQKAKLVETWCSSHVKLVKIVERINGVHSPYGV